MGLLLLLKRRRRRRNAGHAEFAVTNALGSGRVTRRRVGARVLLPPPPLPVLGRGGASFPVTQALGHGRTQNDALLLQLLMSAA